MSLRSILPVLAFASVLLAAPRAHAVDKLNMGIVDLQLLLPDADGRFTVPEAAYLLKYYNGARCFCDDTTMQRYQIRYKWNPAPTPLPPTPEPIRIWVGIGCNTTDLATRTAQCKEIVMPPFGTSSDLDTVREIDYRVRDLVLRPGETTCPDENRTVNHWAVTQNGDTWNTENSFKLAADITADMGAPNVPQSLLARPLEGGITLEWDADLSGSDEIAYYQALCAKADGSLAHSRATNARQYESPRTLCGAERDPTLMVATLKEPIGEPGGTLPTALREFDQRFICGQAAKGATSVSLTDLENGQGYWVTLVAVDTAGNASASYVDRLLTPLPVTDFWEEANDEDGNLQGGFCVSQVGSDGAIGGAVLVALAGVIAARRRRRRGARLARLALLGLVLAPGIASAQSSFSPHWIDDAQGSDSAAAEPTWTLGIRFGPYRPSVDDNFSSDPGPYARTFLKDSYMLAVDVHRVWSVARGQAGFGVTSGYFSNSALAFESGTTRDTPNRPRADGNLTRLSVVPIQLTAIYRATIFDDEMGIPLVPYARAGLGYYLWWAKSPSDELSVAMSCPTCEDKAIGGTIGVVAAAGLAIRAERIDADAARSMQDSGIEHAGFYAEVEGSWISGFGNKTKLSVGDLTWFGGISFEF